MADGLKLVIRGGAINAGVKELRQASERHRWEQALQQTYSPLLSSIRASSMGNSTAPRVSSGFGLTVARLPKKGMTIARIGISDPATIIKHNSIEFGRSSWRPTAGKFWLRRLYESQERRLFSSMARAYDQFLRRNEPIKGVQ